MKSNKKGLSRIISAFFYSLDGLRSAFKNEEAFRQELYLYICLLPLIWLIQVPLLYKLLLVSVNTLVLVVELLNSAIESIVDMVSPEYNAFAKRAKDMGSAAVLLSTSLAGCLWIIAVYKVVTQ